MCHKLFSLFSSDASCNIWARRETTSTIVGGGGNNSSQHGYKRPISMTSIVFTRRQSSDFLVVSPVLQSHRLSPLLFVIYLENLSPRGETPCTDDVSLGNVSGKFDAGNSLALRGQNHLSLGRRQRHLQPKQPQRRRERDKYSVHYSQHRNKNVVIIIIFKRRCKLLSQQNSAGMSFLSFSRTFHFVEAFVRFGRDFSFGAYYFGLV